MSRKIVHVIGTGTIGEPLIGILCDYKEDLGLDEITFHKNTPLTTDRSKVRSLISRGARLSTDRDKFDRFNALDLKPELETTDSIDRATVVIDCTPKGVGHVNKHRYYENYLHNTKGFIAQGSEFGFGKMYARGINDSALVQEEDRFIHVVSCNTHNLSSVVQTIAIDEGEDNLIEGRFNLIRRSNDVSQTSNFVPAPQVGIHKNNVYGTHHARDAALLFETLNMKLNLFSSAMIVNSQYMHILHFYLKLKNKTNIQTIIAKFDANDKVATTDKVNANEVFSFGRDHGCFGRIMNQTVVSIPSLNVRNDTEVTGYCFTPQDGNSLLSSIAIMEWFIYPHSYQDKIQCLSPYFFDEV